MIPTTMALASLKLVLDGFLSLVDVASLVLFKGTAVLLLLLLWVLRLPGLVIYSFLRHVRHSVTELLEFALSLIKDVLVSIVRVDGTTTTAAAAAFNSTVAQVKDVSAKVGGVFGSAAEAFPGLLAGGTKTVAKVVVNIAKNVVEAVKYLSQNVR